MVQLIYEVPPPGRESLLAEIFEESQASARLYLFRHALMIALRYSV